MGKMLRRFLVARLGRSNARPHPVPVSAPPRSRWRYLGRIARVFFVLFLVAGLCGTLIAMWLWSLLTGSLPPLDGEIAVEGIEAPVVIERDELGIPTIRAENRLDLAFATGFAHGQDRFFQMDLLRRHTAGELAELAGPALIDQDRKARVHRFRVRAKRRLSTLSSDDRRLLEAYTRGVRAGLGSLERKPWEYYLLRATPEPWRPEDTLLVALGMFRILQSGCIEHERVNGSMYDLLPTALADYLSPRGSVWDAPLIGGPLAARPMPGPDILDLRKIPGGWKAPPAPPVRTSMLEKDDFRAGSNNWAVAGKLTAHGGAIVANDMHLGLFVPGLWYRAAFELEAEGKVINRVVGITLPGTPVMVVGSNRHIAWGFTNVEGDFADLVQLEFDKDMPDTYKTPDGDREVEWHDELIRVNGGKPVTLRVGETIWGPIYDTDHRKRRRALRWVAHDLDTLNFELMKLESVKSAKQALDIAPGIGAPGQNFVVGDREGNIGWTVLGRFPKRAGFDGTRPMSWADGTCRWVGWMDRKDYPRLYNPPSGRIWTANNRTVPEPYLSRLGIGTYDTGARAKQIRDALQAGSDFREPDMLAIQLDDRALFLRRWQQLLSNLLTPETCWDEPTREAIRREVRSWGGRAAVDSVGFRIVRNFRRGVHDAVVRGLTAPCILADPQFFPHYLDANIDDVVYELITKKPPHLLPPFYSSWEELLFGVIDGLGSEIKARGSGSLMDRVSRYTWGNGHRARIRHPFSEALGPVTRWLELDMPPNRLPGDNNGLPRIQTRSAGASQRMAVSPGKEAEGYFHMPAGQSGHPLSPHYRDGHDAWVRGLATPFLPGEKKYILELIPVK